MTDDEDGDTGSHRWGWNRKGRGWGGPPWMRGQRSPLAMGGRGRMFGQGDLRLLLLALIADKPSHGYDLIRTIEARFGGAYAPSAGTIYPTLTLLEEQELIEAAPESGGKKSYTATAAGRQFLADNSEQVKALMKRIEIVAGASASHGPPESIHHAMHTLRHAILAKPQQWSEAEEARIRDILENAARQILSASKE